MQTVTDSGLRGRGGAAFPTGIKWKTVLDQPAPQKYVTCNADEGDSGTFADRMMMEGDPFVLIEGMTIAGIAVGATEGYIYLRVEYPHARRGPEEAIAAAYDRRISRRRRPRQRQALRSRTAHRRRRLHLRRRDVDAREPRGQARRGAVRPPLPAVEGLFGKPTVVNNVISLASVPIILDKGAAFYRDFGMGRSRGTLPIQLAGNIKHGGLVEKAFGVTLRELLVRLRRRLALRAGRFAPCRSAVRSAPTCRSRSSTRRSTTRRSPASARCSATAASSSSTTPSTWRRWRATPWSSAPSSRAASARRAGSDRRAASR